MQLTKNFIINKHNNRVYEVGYCHENNEYEDWRIKVNLSTMSIEVSDMVREAHPDSWTLKHRIADYLRKFPWTLKQCYERYSRKRTLCE